MIRSLIAVLACGVIGCVAPANADHYVATEQAGAEVCFKASSWDAYPEDRPCTTIGRPKEDGSGDLILGSVGADAATCVIPNVYEERGHFNIECHRVRNR